MKTTQKRIFIILICVAMVFIAVAGIALLKMEESVGISNFGVADYDARLDIWEEPAGNSSDRKASKMNAKKSGNALWYQMLFLKRISTASYKDEERTVDTCTYLYEIKRGYEKETFQDEPYVIPYVSKGSDSAVIVLPGGGFGYKSMDGRNREGRDVAATLQKNGINAFVLHYRSNPYEYPIPLLDVQRAVRFIKSNAEKYGIDPDKIGLLGFSAGGFETGGFINKILGKDHFPEGYKQDKIDYLDDSVAAAAMVYPALSFNSNVPMLFAMFDDDDVRDSVKRKALLKLVDLKKYVKNSKGIPQFIAWGTKDETVGTVETPAYIKAARKVGASVTEVVAEGENHGFGQDHYMDAFLEWFEKTVDKE